MPLFGEAAAAPFDANGVKLGDSESVVLKHYPSAHCQALQWQSRAADRRCDDSRATIGGLEARITVYLRKDVVQAFDVRFEGSLAEQFAKLVSDRYGVPPSEKTTEKARTLEWRKNGERALLTMVPGQRRATLLVWRGDFYEEIYKVR
jgi:hypothetical protein